MKCISVGIYKHGCHDCSNGGISSEFDEVLIPHEQGYLNVDETNSPANLCKVVTKDFGFEIYTFCEPWASVDDGCVGWMAGGSIIYSCDSRFRELSKYPICLHDRQEPQEMYDAMSN